MTARYPVSAAGGAELGACQQVVLDLLVETTEGFVGETTAAYGSGTARQTERRWGAYGVVSNLRIRPRGGV
ncbi:hypothetical protein [Streptomyces sp. NBC_01727]|uniref:hypothetical protein n=1 Tax=Streptomyces sp. NBC_01727 TaxID=2975924 RepID=UPI002E1128E2|nr:hypothetical protein OIE76_37900 [Streptomyces sp. NBC_01727]